MSQDPTALRADLNLKFYYRFLLMGVGALGVAGWFFYDGFYAWPLQHERYTEYKRLTDEFRGDEWEAFAEERGWSTEPPQDDKTEIEINGQFWWAGGCALIGVLLLLKVALARGHWIEADGQRLSTSWGPAFDYASVTQIDKKKWQNKGLAYVSYTDRGRPKRFTVDDLKFDRTATDTILFAMEQAVGVDKIVGGEPEADPAAAVDASPAEAEAGDAPA